MLVALHALKYTSFFLSVVFLLLINTNSVVAKRNAENFYFKVQGGVILNDKAQNIDLLRPSLTAPNNDFSVDQSSNLSKQANIGMAIGKTINSLASIEFEVGSIAQFNKINNNTATLNNDNHEQIINIQNSQNNAAIPQQQYDIQSPYLQPMLISKNELNIDNYYAILNLLYYFHIPMLCRIYSGIGAGILSVYKEGEHLAYNNSKNLLNLNVNYKIPKEFSPVFRISFGVELPIGSHVSLATDYKYDVSTMRPVLREGNIISGNIEALKQSFRPSTDTNRKYEAHMLSASLKVTL